MATLNYSKQRESIKSYLMSTDEHPTADTVYMHVKKEYPNISLATVYRNLNLLAEIGEAQKISTPQGGDRFDGNISQHDHVVCTCCGRVTDIYLSKEADEKINQIAAGAYSGKIQSHTRMFYGLCEDCLKKENYES